MKIAKINKYLREKWQEIALFYPNKTGILKISEISEKKYVLKEVKIAELPNDCWVFENEYYQSPNINNEQKSSFSSAGFKVEKTIIWQKEGFLYLFMIEMKSELSLKELSQCIKKYEHSLNFVITYLAAHPHFQSLTELSIAPVGILCYNAEDDYHKERDFGRGKTKPRFKQKYIDEKKRCFLMEIEPLAFEAKEIPVIFLQTPETGDTDLNINFQEIYQQIQ